MHVLEITNMELRVLWMCVANYRDTYKKELKRSEPLPGDGEIIRQNWLGMLKIDAAMDAVFAKLDALSHQ
ncbi:MAG: hypothetical protein AAB634_02395 [Patescibacteria group bacterium]